MKKILRSLMLVLVVLAITLSAVSCGNSDNGGNGSNDNTCTVTFADTNLSAQSIAKGALLQRPADPNKADSVFVGWYTDAGFANEANFPITVNENITLYARYYTYQEIFREARKNTVGENVPGFSYTYQMDIKASVAGLALTGNTSGKAMYSTTGEVNFYDASTNSGVLLYDGSHYQIRRGTTLQDVSLDETGKMRSFSVEQVGNDYKYDSSSLAKAIFAYSDDQLKSVSATGQPNVYQLNTTMGASSFISLIANYINHPIVEKLLIELPETSADTKMYVTFNGDQLGTYTYEFKVNVSALQFDLKYTLNFTDVGNAQVIVPKAFENIALSSTEIKAMTDEAAAIVSAFRNKGSSGYDFNLETGVDFGLSSGEINSTFKGSAFRKLQGSTVFFHNDIEIDSDFKNSDLYKQKGIDDVHVKHTKLSTGEVYLIEKNLLRDNTQKVNNFTDSDWTSFYLFDVLSKSGTYSFTQKVASGSNTTYTFGLTNSGAAELLAWLNSGLDLDPLGKASVNASVYGKLNASSVAINSGTVTVVVKNGALYQINVAIEGDAKTAFEQSVDFTAVRDAQIKLDMTITANAAGDNFAPYNTVNAAK